MTRASKEPWSNCWVTGVGRRMPPIVHGLIGPLSRRKDGACRFLGFNDGFVEDDRSEVAFSRRPHIGANGCT